MSTDVPNTQTNNSRLLAHPEQVPDPGSPWAEALEERRKIIEKFNHILTELEPHEKTWMERYHMLLAQGFQLRPRMRPDWQPSWLGPDGNGNAFLSEDGEVLRCRSDAVDATRISDGRLVWIKRLFAGREEMQMLQRLCLPSSPLARDPKNPAAPIFQTFVDPEDSNYSFVVMPFLRPAADPPFGYIGEVCDFIDQILEGLAYLHEHGIVHGIKDYHIRMDASEMYPEGFHPIQRDILPDYSRVIKPLPRSEAIPKYYYTGFDVSVFISSHDSESDPAEPQTARPELAAFKVDISDLGTLLQKELFERFTNLEILWPLIHSMVKESPDNTLPSAAEVMEKWIEIKKKISPADRKKPLLSHGGQLTGGGYALDVTSIVRVILHFAFYLISLVRGR